MVSSPQSTVRTPLSGGQPGCVPPQLQGQAHPHWGPDLADLPSVQLPSLVWVGAHLGLLCSLRPLWSIGNDVSDLNSRPFPSIHLGSYVNLGYKHFEGTYTSAPSRVVEAALVPPTTNTCSITHSLAFLLICSLDWYKESQAIMIAIRLLSECLK